MDNRERALIARDKRDIWHPFTQMADWLRDDPAAPLVIARGNGNYLYDVAGKKYFDGVSSLWVTVHGHRHPVIDAAVRRQLGRIAHSTFLGLTHEPAIQLAEELLAVAPAGLEKVFYSDNGSTAVEIALKMAYQYWRQADGRSRRDTFLSLKNAYHGDTIGSVSVGGMDLFHTTFRPLLFSVRHAPAPFCYRCPWRQRREAPGNAATFSAHCGQMGCGGECLTGAEALLERHHARLAAAIIEPLVQGAAGMITLPPGYTALFARACRRQGVLLICDEVATGFGRTGTMFAVEQEKVRPDIMCVSKGITGGYLPLAATLTTGRIYRAFLGRFDEFKTFFHGHTYTANPLACAAARANLRVFTAERTLARLAPKIRALTRALDGLRDVPWVGDIRQRGLMAGIELVRDTRTRADFPPAAKIGARVCAACREDGVLIRPLGNVIVLMPPLSSTERELRRLVATVRAGIRAVADSYVRQSKGHP